MLLYIARDPDARLRTIAERVGITERAAVGIVADLEAEGYVSRSRVGRRNHYTIDQTLPLRHPLERDHAIGEVLELLRPPSRQA